MPERASALERVQFGVEVTPGTLVAADKRLMGTMLNPRNRTAARSIRGAGSLYGVATSVGRTHTECPFEGELCYNDLEYLLAAHLCAPTFAGRVATFAPDDSGPNTIKTFTFEVGSATRMDKFGYGFVPDIQLRFTQTECHISGLIVGRKATRGATLTATPTRIAPVPILPGAWDVYIGVAMDGSNLTRLTRVLSADFVSRGRWKPGFFADASQASFVTPVELAPDTSLQIALEDDSAGSAYMANLQAGDRRLVRLVSTSLIEATAGVTYALTIEFPFTFQEADEGPNDDVEGISYTLTPEYDAGWNTTGGALKIVVTGSPTAIS